MLRNKVYVKQLTKCLLLWTILTQRITDISGHKLEWGPCLVHFLEPCHSDNIQFYLFSSARPMNQIPVILDAVSPEVPDWVNLTYPLKIIIHGYGGFVDYNATRMIRTAYLATDRDLNILVVDWGKLARLPCYPTAVINTKQAGECLASLLINWSNKQRIANASQEVSDVFHKIHTIGFSLGAHVAGFASNSVEYTLGKRFSRITALDPALPFFATPLRSWKLDKTDADFVDVIHTNGGVFGKVENCGHIDFYVNGGLLQPQCADDKSECRRFSFSLSERVFNRQANVVTAVLFSVLTNTRRGFIHKKLCKLKFSLLHPQISHSVAI